ncbi:type II toxin-antitoxin system prevent-host-death family antitoxin [Teredinibacter turnerae]|uniref:type II toxin-antitoxin system Phd/YefM family antitoxin n=1 Tax=Teredinibacter turnerae TaxID=2426 RepID=UPI00036A618C|nr:type II toxin-antitoxin system prevent-host-death family antitoxin [Teredinibacter turnerae]
MRTVNISDFRANLLKYLEKANAGEHFCVTTNGKHIATITPPANRKQLAQQQLAKLAEQTVIEDIVSPTDAEWDANL